MRGTRFVSAVSFSIGVWFLLQCAPAAWGQNPSVAFSVNPNEFRAGQSATALLSVASNSLSLTLSTGDKFTFIFDASIGTVSSVSPNVSVNSPVLAASDFSASSTATQVVVTYNGASKPLSFGTTVAVEVHFTASGQVGTGKVSFSSRFTGSVNGNLPYTTLSIVDFANGGVTSVIHDPTLSGDGTSGFPLGVVPGSVPITTDATTLTGNGTSAAPLGVDPAFVTNLRASAAQMGSKRAALQQFWTSTPRYDIGLGATNVGSSPQSFVQSDGLDLWVANSNSTVSRVRASDGKLLDTWTDAVGATSVLVAMGRVFVAGNDGGHGLLFMIDPTQPGGPVTEVAQFSSPLVGGLAFDGSRIWIASAPSVLIVTPGATTPWSVTTVSTGPSSLPLGILFDGSNMWVTDGGDKTLKKLDGSGAIVQMVNVGKDPKFPVFDGTNIWVPNFFDDSVTVVRAATGAVVATLTGNGLSQPTQAAFDGQRVLVTNQTGSVSLWKAADLTPMGSFSTGPGSSPFGACSDGTYFWITLYRVSQRAAPANILARF